ncbi:MAG: TetR/AcrR family transcriptional regulator [Micrococcales bacterium]|nr:TetR/AcrR family transcriptional regulator [Micrococcales bacterium]
MDQGQPAGRGSLTVERILEEAMALSDADGLAGLSMRALGKRLGVEGMAVYHHVANKEALLDALVDEVFREIALPEGEDWRAGLRTRSVSERHVLRRHPWAIGLVESRTAPGPATLAHQDHVIGFLRATGFGVRAAAQVLAFLDAYVYGFVLQEVALPTDPAPVVDTLREPEGPNPYPNLTAVVVEVVDAGYDFGAEFDVGLELLLDGIAGLRT